MTFIGLVLIPLCAILMLRAPQTVFYLMIAFTAFSSTAVVNLPGFTFGLQPWHLFSAALAILFLVGVIRIPASGHAAAITTLLAGFLIAILLSIFAKAIESSVAISNFTQAAIAVDGLITAAMVAFFCSSEKRLLAALRVFVWSAVAVALWGIFQAACGYIGLPYPAWLFNNSISDSADMFAQSVGGIPRISSVAVEPSFFARYAVAGAGIALVMADISSGRERFYYRAAAALIVLTAIGSTSTSAYIGLVLLFALWIAMDVRRGWIAAIAASGGLLLLAMVEPSFVTALWRMTGDKAASGSFYERFGSVLAALRLFGEHPLFGHGWDELASYDVLSALLYHVGAVGWLSFLALCLYALIGGLPNGASAAADDQFATRTARLSIGLRAVFACVLGVDAVSGISYVAANLWVVLGLTLAVQGLQRQQALRWTSSPAT
ncbi:O-antigen ligase family protein [Consotaella aegiceratis]|uniref:O-antigen ligase family protein n=1 Tax=Consotaella aegiceratis TaxID=3097961 RepID=UPI002F42F34A